MGTGVRDPFMSLRCLPTAAPSTPTAVGVCVCVCVYLPCHLWFSASLQKAGAFCLLLPFLSQSASTSNGPVAFRHRSNSNSFSFELPVLGVLVRDVQRQVHSHPCAFLLSAFLRAKHPIGKRERSDFPQSQTYQCYVRVVVLGVLKRAVFWAEQSSFP